MAQFRVLLVDDYESQYLFINDLLLLIGEGKFQLEWVSTYRQGLKALLNEHYDLGLVDYHLGDASGVNLIKEAHAAGCRIPLILLTGSGSFEIDLEAMEAGAADYLDKTTLKPAALERAIRYTIEHARTLEALRESEERYRDLFENSNDLIQSIDGEGRFLYVNQAWLTVLGYSTDEVEQLSIFDIVHPHRLPHFMNTLEQVRTGEVRIIETTFVTRHQTYIEVEGNINSKVQNGQVVSMRGIFRDVTARKQAQAAEREQRAFAEALLDITTALNSTYDFDEVLSRILTNMGTVIPHDTANIMLIEAGRVWVVGEDVTLSTAPRMVDESYLAVADTDFISQMYKSRQPMLISHAAAGSLNPIFTEPVFFSYVGVPVILDGEVIGFLNLGSHLSGFFTDIHAQRLQAFADHAAIAIRNARAYEHVQEMAASAERQRLARDLHDAVSQTLFSASLIAEALPRLWQKHPEEVWNGLGQLSRLTKGALAEMRTLLLELRPHALVEASFRTLLEHLTTAFASRSSAQIFLEINGERELPPIVQISLYRIAQEALNNIHKHARAAQVQVQLQNFADGVELRVLDDGCGFDPYQIPPDHLGVRIMRERALEIEAQLSITSQPGNGTQIAVLWHERKD
ncbi:MAG: PAS domain S-box protein [Anaerolineales bacterium]|nr:PAS domain S-box protein [Anaerolineales bacterium]